MAKMSRENQKEHFALGGLDRDLVKINDHHDVFHVVADLPIPRFLPRQLVFVGVWRWGADKKELTAVYDNFETGDFPVRKEYLRASATSMYAYKQEADEGGVAQTKVTWTQQMDLGGRIPKWVQNGLGVDFLMYVARGRGGEGARGRGSEGARGGAKRAQKNTAAFPHWAP
jgi:hypothetical protein